MKFYFKDLFRFKDFCEIVSTNIFVLEPWFKMIIFLCIEVLT